MRKMSLGILGPEQPLPRLVLTMNEAAACIGISVRKLYDLVDRGEIRTIKIGRCVRVSTRELEAFIERLVEGGQTRSR